MTERNIYSFIHLQQYAMEKEEDEGAESAG